MTELEAEFHQAMVGIHSAAVEIGYRPNYFLQMVTERGGLGTARRLLRAPEAQSGLARLWKLDRLDISMEAFVLQEKWKELFSDDERRTARERLEAYGYDFRLLQAGGPSMRLVFVRHAQTLANTERRFQGQAPPPAFGLSPAGWEQAAALRRRFESEGFAPTHFYCSPLQRCLDTASALAGLWDLDPVRWDDLQEIDVGIVQGLTWDEAKRKYPDVDLGEMSSVDVPGAESLRSRRQRAERVVERALRDHDADATVLMVSHGGILRHIVPALLGAPRSWAIDIGNTAVFDFRVDSARWDEGGDAMLNPELWRIERFNDTSHLI